MKKKHGLENSYKKLRMGGMFYSKGGGADMSPKQKAIAAKAPPPNVLDGKDFAVLREEKAKNRGMGLQDEKMKPGKIMKANKGKDIKVKRIGKSEDELTEFEKRRLKLKAGD